MDHTAIGSPELTATLSQLFLLVISAIASFIARPLFQFLRSRLTTNQFAYLTDIVTHAVQATEQYGLNGEVEDKKEAAYAIVLRQLSAAGITLTDDQIDDAIEAAVLREFNQYRSTTTEAVDPFAAPEDPGDGDGEASGEPATDTPDGAADTDAPTDTQV